MLLEDLVQRFIVEVKRDPFHVTELHNFIKKNYLLGELCIVEYKKLFFELGNRYPELTA
jgi:hypothetical protein